MCKDLIRAAQALMELNVVRAPEKEVLIHKEREKQGFKESEQVNGPRPDTILSLDHRVVPNTTDDAKSMELMPIPEVEEPWPQFLWETIRNRKDGSVTLQSAPIPEINLDNEFYPGDIQSLYVHGLLLGTLVVASRCYDGITKREEWHRSKSPEGHYKKHGGLYLKIACPIFKGKKHDDPDVHIQDFEQYAELKHILEEEWREYFPHTLKEAAKKWYHHYPASKPQSYKKLKKAFIREYTNDQGDEDILCELDRIKQGKLSVKKYVQKIKELTRRLNESPYEKRMRAWFLSGFNSKKLK
ncbi:hypothetical protein L7F22_061571 [Adiantum nelumboides]|nr:hypothetical protein [Adiantum nelumboides]